MRQGQNINTNRSLKEVDSNSQGWPWGIKDFSERSNCRLKGKEQKLELELEPKDVTELQQSHDKTWMDEELLLMDQ